MNPVDLPVYRKNLGLFLVAVQGGTCLIGGGGFTHTHGNVLFDVLTLQKASGLFWFCRQA